MNKCCHPDYTSELKRLNRIQGQIEGIKKMVEEGRYCPDIIIQVQAVSSALKSFGGVLLRTHIDNCVYDAFNNKNEEDKKSKIDELIKIFIKNN